MGSGINVHKLQIVPSPFDLLCIAALTYVDQPGKFLTCLQRHAGSKARLPR